MINVGNVDYMASVEARLRQHIMVRGPEGRSPHETDEIFLFQRLISSQNDHENLDYMGARLAQHIMGYGAH